MALKILRRIRAAEDAEAIANYISKQSPDAALRFLYQAEGTLAFLAQNPDLGGKYPSNIPELAEMRVWRVDGFPNHLIFYLRHASAIEIVRILPGAMDIEAQFREAK